MASLNKVQIIGRLGRDPDVRQTSGGISVSNFSLAVDESYKDRDGNKQDKVEWFNLVVWDKSEKKGLVTSVVIPYLHKGDLIYAEGRLQSRQYEKDDVLKTIVEVNVFSIQMLSTKRNDEQTTAPVKSKPKTRTVVSHDHEIEDEEGDADVGF